MFRRLVLTALIVLTMIAAACGGDDTAGEVQPPDDTTSDVATTEGTDAPDVSPPDEIDDRLPVVMDTDMAVEGAMAVLYLLEHPDVRVEAITVSGTGLVTCRKGVDQALGLIALAEAGDIPVACGPASPLSGDLAFPSSYRTSANSLSGVLLPAGGDASALTAPELLASVIGNSTEPVAVYADGPLTNVALMFAEDPSLVDNISGITIMGGAFDVPGNVADNPDAEWNIYIDPEAADQVLAAGAPVTLVPLDATVDVPLTTLHLVALEEYQSTAIAETVFKLARGVSGIEQGFVYLWDQLNAAVLLDDSLVTIEERSIAVITEGGPTVAGVTVDDPGGVTVRVAVEADREAFERAYFTLLLGEPFEPVDLTPDVLVTVDSDGWGHNLPEVLPTGTLILGFENNSDQSAGAVIGWLTGDATLEDLDAWGSTEQPPFFDVAGFAAVEAGGTWTTVMELTHVGDNILVGLLLDSNSTTRLAIIEVG